MGILMNIAGALSNALAEIKAGGALPVSTDNALVVTHHPNDPLLTALDVDGFILGQGGQLSLNNNVLLATAGTGSLDVSTARAVALQVIPAAGTVTAGTISFEGSNDGTNFVPMLMVDKAAMASAPVSSFTLAAATPRYFLGNVFFKYFRARISVAVTGTTTGVQAFTTLLAGELSFALQQVRMTDGTNVMPSGDAVARGIFVKPTDGTSAQTMKAASTAAAAADIGAVVTLSPNLPVPSVSQGVAAATINATVVKASAGTLYSLSVTNANAAVRYLKVWNKATTVAPATDSAVLFWVIPVPATSTLTFELGFLGMRFSAGIGIATVTLPADTDVTAVAAGDLRWAINYI